MEEKQINNNYNTILGYLNLNVTIPKQTFYFEEEIPVNIKGDIKALFKKVDKIENQLYRKIEWIGYMKNSLLEKSQISSVPYNYNEDKYAMFAKIIYVFSFLNNVKNLFSDYNFFEFFSEISKEKYGIKTIEKINKKFKKLGSDEKVKDIIGACSDEIGKEIMRLDAKKTKFNENPTMISKGKKSINFDCIKRKIAKEKLQKFINFKGKKIVGFEEFVIDITPPVKGYYFKCNYNLKTNVHLSGVVYNQKILKQK